VSYALAFSLSCALSRHPAPVTAGPMASGDDWAEILARPGVIELESVVSARWEVSLSGLLNLDHPDAIAAGLSDHPAPIVLPIHVLWHPDAGVFIVDTGITRAQAAGERGPTRGLLGAYLSSVEPGEPLGDVLARQEAPVAGALITHAHVDHVLGLPDLPPGAPVWLGPGELSDRAGANALMRRTWRALLEGREDVRTWDFARSPAIGPIQSAIDLLGDGSLWALHTPGHTVGSTSYLANTTRGPVLFTGDACHTYWGWNHGVEPGSFNRDGPAAAESLAALKSLADAHPMTVYVGHELDGAGPGVAAVPALVSAVEPDPLPHALRAPGPPPPETLPPPFSAAALRAGLPEGTEIIFRVTAGGPPMIQSWSFMAPDDEGVTVRATVDDDQPEDSRSSWAALAGHATFPSAITTRVDREVTVEAGTFDAWGYEVAGPDGGVRRYFFAPSMPGPPVWMEALQGDEVLMTMELVARHPPG